MNPNTIFLIAVILAVVVLLLAIAKNRKRQKTELKKLENNGNDVNRRFKN